MKEILILTPKEMQRAGALWVAENRKDLLSHYTHIRMVWVSPEEIKFELFNESEELGLKDKDKEREHKRLIRMNKDEGKEEEKLA